MNVRHLVNDIMIITGILFWACGYALAGYGQSKYLDEVKFDPPDPKPGGELEVRITFYPRDPVPEELSIGLITWTDADGDYKYEKHEDPWVTVKASDTDRYEGDFGDEVYVPVYKIDPTTPPPEKYTVLVKCGNDLVSESITIPPSQATSGRPTPDLNWAKPWLIPIQVAEKLSTLTDIFKHTSDEPDGKDISNLYVYDIEQAQLTAMTINTRNDTFYESPIWSPDGQQIAAVVERNRHAHIALIEVADHSVRNITEGPEDASPLWLPDGKSLLFLRNNRIYLADLEQSTIRPIAVDFPIAELLAVSRTHEGMLNILYRGWKRVTYDGIIVDTGKLAIYVLELDGQFNLRANSRHELSGDKIWLFSKMVSPVGDHIVHSDTANTTSTLILERIDGAEKIQLFEDEYNYYEPAWSPDGEKIVFVSDRP